MPPLMREPCCPQRPVKPESVGFLRHSAFDFFGEFAIGANFLIWVKTLTLTTISILKAELRGEFHSFHSMTDSCVVR